MDSPQPGHPEPAPRRRAPLWARALLLLVTLSVLLVPLELLARSRFTERYQRLTAAGARSRAASADPEHLILLDIVQPSPWRDLVYDLVPSLQGRFEGARYRSNSLGMRDVEIAVPKPPGVFRIALLGDSFSFGWGVEVEQCYANLIETQFGELVAGRRIEVLNLGVPGYNTAIEAACLEHKALAMQPDLVLVQYFYNDAYLPNFVLKEQGRPASYLLDWIASLLGARPAAGGALTQPSPEGEGQGDAAPAPEQNVVAPWRRDPALVPAELAYMVGPEGIERALQRIADLAAPLHARLALLVLALPSVRMVTDPSVPAETSGLDLQVAQIGERLGFSVITTLEPLTATLRAAGRSPMELILSPKDWHPNVEGHQLYAKIIVDGLKKAGLLEAPR
jgi:lysophospholipase L1-like esterase